MPQTSRIFDKLFLTSFSLNKLNGSYFPRVEMVWHKSLVNRTTWWGLNEMLSTILTRSTTSESVWPSLSILMATIVGPGLPPMPLAVAWTTRPKAPSPRMWPRTSWSRSNSQTGSTSKVYSTSKLTVASDLAPDDASLCFSIVTWGRGQTWWHFSVPAGRVSFNLITLLFYKGRERTWELLVFVYFFSLKQRFRPLRNYL